ncbi:MAG: PqqD family peptide modification chaperone [Scytonematopsis contorta HA4267-MV1]|nr:PqqD family peptide modification chaperone [Scytonematopsis contorta HA4267-MV1]
MNLQQVEQAILESSTVAATAGQISSDLGGETVILNINTGVYHSLSNVGVRIWELIQQPKAVSDIKEVLLQEYDVEPSVCLNDLVALLSNLLAAGLIEVSHETTA